MPAELNFFDTYTLMAVYKRVVPKKTFFRDRYFPTSDEDIFASNKVLTEYMDGDQKMAAFVAPRVGAIPMERMGYEIHELEPAFIGMSRELSTDDLTKRGFGEAIYANSTPAQRAAKLTQKDLADMDARIVRREEWMHHAGNDRQPDQGRYEGCEVLQPRPRERPYLCPCCKVERGRRQIL